MKKFVSNVEWLDSGEELPTGYHWTRSNEKPAKGTKRFVLSTNEINQFSCSEGWIIYQPGLSSINKSYLDYPEEFECSCVVKVKYLSQRERAKPTTENRPVYDEPDIWFEVEVLEVIRICDLPNRLQITDFDLPNLNYANGVQYFEYENFVCLFCDDQGYAGDVFVLLKQNDDLVLVIYESWCGEEQEGFFTSYKLKESEKRKVFSYSSNKE